MADESLSVAGQLPAALSAFLRGAERRAFVFLWLQGGDAAAAERALAAAIRAFPGPAAAMPMAEWPLRFWKLLAALPVQAGAGSWPPGSEALATMPASARQALLLRMPARAPGRCGLRPRRRGSPPARYRSRRWPANRCCSGSARRCRSRSAPRPARPCGGWRPGPRRRWPGPAVRAARASPCRHRPGCGASAPAPRPG